MRPARILGLLAVLAFAGAVAWIAFRKSAGSSTSGAPAVPSPPPPPPPAEPVAFAIAGPIDDRLGPEPCSGIVGAGLWSFPAFVDGGRTQYPLFVALSMGNVSAARGIAGHRILGLAVEDVFAPGQVQSMLAGPLELRHGAEFARFALASPSFPVLCANATDASGAPVLRPFVALSAGSRTVVVCGTVSPTFEQTLRDAGSDIRLAPLEESLRRAVSVSDETLSRVERKASIRILLHHGPREEAEALVRAVPGFTFAVAATGDELPDELRAPGESGVPVFTTGRRFRFGLRVLVLPDGSLEATHARIGVQVQDLGSPLDGMLRTFPAELDRVLAAERPGNGRPDQRQLRNGASYVGADTCARCHAEAATAWRNSAHARPFSAYAPGKEDLSTPSCMTCHTSGAFEQGGWTGPEDTSDLGSVSCESCHGPGSLHAADPKPGYGAMPRQACGGCHTPDRSSRLDAETVWKAAGHAFK